VNGKRIYYATVYPSPFAVYSLLIISILVEMFAGEGQFIVQPVREKNLIEAGTSVFESRRGSVKKQPPHADK